jgi:hypothetical protein
MRYIRTPIIIIIIVWQTGKVACRLLLSYYVPSMPIDANS